MKIILSRKGFDSANGGIPSPILPGGTLLSFPIPSKQDNDNYSEIMRNGKSLYEIIKELKPSSKIKENYTCHLDPDIYNYDLHKNWAPLFGQTKSSQTHLENHSISIGDIFLFFGWFKGTEYISDKLEYKKEFPDVHIIWGYLQIGKIYKSIEAIPQQFQYHPHATTSRFKDINCIYQATDKLTIDSSYNGYGIFKYHPELVLTKEGMSRSKWKLPEKFKEISISYHSKESFKKDYFDSAKIGQEFVIEERDWVTDWALNIIKNGTGTSI